MLWLSLLLLLLLLAPTSAFPSGAGNCPRGIPGVVSDGGGIESFHTNDQFGQRSVTQVEFGDSLNLILNGEIISGRQDAVLQLSTLTTYTLEIVSLDETTTTFKGALIAIHPSSSTATTPTSFYFDMLPLEESIFANACEFPSMGVTHFNAREKTMLSSEASFPVAGTATLDVTVVVTNTATESIYAHQTFELQIMDEDDEQRKNQQPDSTTTTTTRTTTTTEIEPTLSPPITRFSPIFSVPTSPPTFDGDICYVCNGDETLRIQNPETSFVFIVRSTTCGALEQAGLTRTLPTTLCASAQQAIEQNGCICASSSITNTAMPTPRTTSTPTPAPTEVSTTPTPTPTTTTPTPSPTLTPTSEIPTFIPSTAVTLTSSASPSASPSSSPSSRTMESTQSSSTEFSTTTTTPTTFFNSPTSTLSSSSSIIEPICHACGNDGNSKVVDDDDDDPFVLFLGQVLTCGDLARQEASIPLSICDDYVEAITSTCNCQPVEAKETSSSTTTDAPSTPTPTTAREEEEEQATICHACGDEGMSQVIGTVPFVTFLGSTYTCGDLAMQQSSTMALDNCDEYVRAITSSCNCQVAVVTTPTVSPMEPNVPTVFTPETQPPTYSEPCYFCGAQDTKLVKIEDPDKILQLNFAGGTVEFTCQEIVNGARQNLIPSSSCSSFQNLFSFRDDDDDDNCKCQASPTASPAPTNSPTTQPPVTTATRPTRTNPTNDTSGGGAFPFRRSSTNYIRNIQSIMSLLMIAFIML